MSDTESEHDDLFNVSADTSTSKSSVATEKKSKQDSPVTTPEPEDEGETYDVTFLCKGDTEKSITITLPANCTVKVLKDEIARVFHLQERNVRLHKSGRKLQEFEVLSGRSTYKVQSDTMSVSVVNGETASESEEVILEFGLDESESEDQPEESIRTDSISNIRITASRIKDLTGSKDIEVAVQTTVDSKEFLGGYRNKKTGAVYYNATSQTVYKNARLFSTRLPAVTTYNRETQTLLPLIDEGVNTLADKSTQIGVKSVYIPDITDRILTVKTYQPYDESNKRMTPEAAARILQRAWKVFIQKRKLDAIYKALAEERAAKDHLKGSTLKEYQTLAKTLLTRSSFPTTRSDFYDLYTALGEWKIKELARLKERKSGFAYKVAVGELLRKETEGLLAIEEQRIKEREENLQRQDILFLEETSRSRVRRYPNGGVTVIDDLNILKAREFKELFASYTRKDVTKTERIEILSSIRQFLSQFDPENVTLDMIELLGREIEMMNIGIEEKHLAILRKRFQSMFINMARNPEFNPQAKYFKTSNETKTKYPRFRCSSCNKVMIPSKMLMHLRLNRFKTCMSCSYMNTTASAKTNLAPYKRLLNSLRSAEEEKGCRSAIPYLLQPMGMYFLVNILWDGMSIISGSSNLAGLKVTRWLPNEEWSMWNMILLTEYEALHHDRLENPLDHYRKDFVLNVMNRNIRGRIHFNAVADIETKFRRRDYIGALPKDHLLYTDRKTEEYLPKNNPHPFLNPGKVPLQCDTKAETRDACN